MRAAAEGRWWLFWLINNWPCRANARESKKTHGCCNEEVKQHLPPFNLEETVSLTLTKNTGKDKGNTSHCSTLYAKFRGLCADFRALLYTDLTKDLTKPHIFAAVLHCILWGFCIGVLCYTSGSVKSYNTLAVWKNQTHVRLPIVPKWPYCKGNVTGSDREQCDAEDSEEFGQISLVSILLVLQTCTFVGHVIQACLCYRGDEDFKSLSENGIKIIFWIEYTFSGSLIAFVAAFFSGTIDIKALLMVLSSQSSLMLLGLLIDVLRYLEHLEHLEYLEHLEDTKSEISKHMRDLFGKWFYWVPKALIFLVGFANVSIIWIPGLVKVVDNFRKHEGKAGSSMPDLVLGFYITEITLYASFGVVQLIFTYECAWKCVCFLFSCCCCCCCNSKVWEFKDKMRLEHNIHSMLSFFSKAVLVIFFVNFFLFS